MDIRLFLIGFPSSVFTPQLITDTTFAYYQKSFEEAMESIEKSKSHKDEE